MSVRVVCPFIHLAGIVGKVWGSSLAQLSELASQSIRAAFTLAALKPVLQHQPPAFTR